MASEKLPLILSVDDEPANLVLLTRILQGKYRVVPVTSGKDALEMLTRDSFDLILLDIMMPGMTGLQTLEIIRGKQETSDIPIILISALSDAQNVSHGLEAGANDYIVKPIDMDVTIARVQTQIALKQLQDQRKQTITDLQTAQEMKSRFLKIASHDLKGPLMNISMATGLLREGLGENQDQAYLLEILESSTETMQMLIKDFLDTAAMDTAALDIKLDRVSLNDLISDLMTEHGLNAQRKNIALRVANWEGVIRADLSRFHQVLGNLVSNAVKYSPPDTTVTIWTELDDSTVTVFVEDQGPGIPEAEQGRLFTQFGKLSPRPTGGESSTGLGLWIAKHLISLQNGDIGYISPPEGGSVFWIRMPAF